MLREHQRAFGGALLALDMVSIFSFTSCLFCLGHPLQRLEASLTLSFLAFAIWPFLAWKWQVYHSRRLKKLNGELWLIVKVMFFSFGFATLGTSVLWYSPLDGWRITAAALGCSILLFGMRIPIRLFLKRIRSLGYNTRYIVMLGTAKEGEKVAHYLEGNPHFGLSILGFFKFPGEPDSSLNSLPLLGSTDELSGFLEKNVVDEIILCPSPVVNIDKLKKVINISEEQGVPVRLVPNILSPRASKVCMSWFGEIPTLTWFTGPSESIAINAKRVVDILGATIGLLVSSPIFLVTAILIKLTSRGPVFFRQTRCGLHGREFQLLKFRTMVNDAEKLKKKLLNLNEEDGPAFKMKQDPRVTPVGRILRKFSIDELPQLINVLKGEMSLVGPRPPVPEEVKRYDRWQRRRLSVKPGLTCIWQIHGRNKVTFKEWMEMDMEYIDNWSLTLDLKLMLLTIPAVLKGTGI